MSDKTDKPKPLSKKELQELLWACHGAIFTRDWNMNQHRAVHSLLERIELACPKQVAEMEKKITENQPPAVVNA